jgi:hypothetical protein
MVVPYWHNGTPFESCSEVQRFKSMTLFYTIVRYDKIASWQMDIAPMKKSFEGSSMVVACWHNGTPFDSCSGDQRFKSIVSTIVMVDKMAS